MHTVCWRYYPGRTPPTPRWQPHLLTGSGVPPSAPRRSVMADLWGRGISDKALVLFDRDHQVLVGRPTPHDPRSAGMGIRAKELRIELARRDNHNVRLFLHPVLAGRWLRGKGLRVAGGAASLEHVADARGDDVRRLLGHPRLGPLQPHLIEAHRVIAGRTGVVGKAGPRIRPLAQHGPG